VPLIVADPTGGQRAGVSFNFNGSTSQPGDLLNIECYQWELDSGATSVFDGLANGCDECPTPGDPGCVGQCTERGIDTSNLTITVGQVGDDIDITLGVKLKVSNIPNVSCNNLVDPGLIFGQNVANLSNYRIQCDPTDPAVEAGPNQTGALDTPPLGRVDFVLSAQGFDPESTSLFYRWECTDAVSIDPPNGEAQTVTCSYTTVTAATARVTVTNECGRTNSDGLTLTVLQN
jgi:hypothetical protein